jgi:hypothetical protein
MSVIGMAQNGVRKGREKAGGGRRGGRVGLLIWFEDPRFRYPDWLTWR